MIIARGCLAEQEEGTVYYDYGSIIIPQGMTSPDKIYFFNREQVDDLRMKGYINEAEKEFASNYDTSMAGCPYPKEEVE